MTYEQIVKDAKFLITGRSDGTIDFSDADICASANRALEKTVSLIMRADNRWEWDDSNFTTLPIGTRDLVAGQSDYGIEAAQFVNVLRVEIKDISGNWIFLSPISYEDKKGVAMTEWAKTPGIPRYYDKVSDSIILYPTPNYNSIGGLKVYCQRSPSYFTVSDTTKEAGFIPLYHRLISLGIARDYCLANGMQNKLTIIDADIMRMENELIERYSQRSKDERARIGFASEDYGVGEADSDIG